MEEITAVAAAETISVLYNTEISLVTKIPYAILKTLEDKAEEYAEKVNIDMTLELHEQPISDEAKAILAIIYKDYWCDNEKKEEMNKIFEEKALEYDKEQEEALNPFKTINKQETESTQNTETVSSEPKFLIAKPKKWYIRIFDRIMRFFRKK